MAPTATAPSRTQFKDKEKPAEVRSSNIVAAKGMFCFDFQLSLMLSGLLLGQREWTKW
jgi:hypothetical protein